MQVKPIRTEEDYQEAIARIEALWGISLGDPDSDELEILLVLTGAYEKKHHGIEPPDPSALIAYRLDQMGLSQKDIDRFLESRKRLPEILSRESGLSVEIIKGLQDIPLDVLATDGQ